MSGYRPLLVVEDSQFDLELILSALGRLGIKNPIDTARDGVEALNYLSAAGRAGWCPAVTLLDLKLPRATGLDVLRYSRGQDRFCQMPVVMLAGSAAEDDVCAAYRFGASGYVVKPMRFADMLRAAASIVEFWLGHNLPPPSACPPLAAG